MTKKTLKWRLKELPDATSVAGLVEQGVVTKEEARNILFDEFEELKASEREKELQRQVEFLEDLVKELSRNRTTVMSWPVYIEKYVKTWPSPWPQVWYNTGTNRYSSNISATNYTQKLIG